MHSITSLYHKEMKKYKTVLYLIYLKRFFFTLLKQNLPVVDLMPDNLAGYQKELP